MIKKKLTLALALAAAVLTAHAKTKILDGWNYTVRLGYNIGGTAPIGLPPSIRSLNSYKLQPNFSLGFDVQKPMKGRWGVLTGIHIENKGMEIDADVKNYHMAMVKGGEKIEGYYTGSQYTNTEEWMTTIPIMATFSASRNVTLKAGPYISYVSTRIFKGHAHDGYIRLGTPTGNRIVIGNTEGTRGDYDFSNDMRRLQWGVDVGADWQFHHRWGAYADLQWGLSGIHKSSFHTIEQTLYPIFGTMGITYRLK